MKLFLTCICAGLLAGSSSTAKNPLEKREQGYGSLVAGNCCAQWKPRAKEELLFSDDFSSQSLAPHWLAEWNEKEPGSFVGKQNGKLMLNTQGGVTVWLNRKLSGNMRIVCNRKVLIEGGSNDRLSDMNFFWMAQEPFTQKKQRSGTFEEYDSLNMYYAGIGGNYNTTSRFRKYEHSGTRSLLKEYSDSAHLLSPNKEYLVEIIIRDGTTSFSLNEELFFSYKDPAPYLEGYFGIRSTKSRQWVDDLKIYRIP